MAASSATVRIDGAVVPPAELTQWEWDRSRAALELLQGLVGGDNDAPADLPAARSALWTLKTALGPQQLEQLLAERVDAADTNFRRWAAESGSRLTPAVVDFDVTGLAPADFFAYAGPAFTRADWCLTAHPDHYVLHPDPAEDAPAGRMFEIEEVGGEIVRWRLDSAPLSQAPDEPDPAYEVHRVARHTLTDGTVAARGLHQWRRTERGLQARIGIWFPAAVPADVAHGHRRHLAVEFRNWFAMVAGGR